MAERPDIHPRWLAAMWATARLTRPLPRPLARAAFAALGHLHALLGPPFANRARTLARVALGQPAPPRWLPRWWRHVGEAMRWTRGGALPPGALDGVDALAGGGLVVGGHFGPYLFTAPLLARHGLRARQVAVPLPLPWADEAVFGRHRAEGLLLSNPASPAALSRAVLRALQDGEVVLATVDQAPADRDHTRAVPFLRGTLDVAAGVFELARQADAPVFGLVLDADDGRLSGRLLGPFRLDDAGSAEEVLAACVGLLAEAVERDPAGWNWMLPRLTGP